MLMSLDEALKIYQKSTDFVPPKFNGRPRVTQYLPAFKAEFPGFTKEDHLSMAYDCIRWYLRMQKAWMNVHTKAVNKYPEDKLLVSGLGYASNAPEEVKEKLRRYAHASGDFLDGSVAHWRAAGKRQVTWLFSCKVKIENQSK